MLSNQPGQLEYFETRDGGAPGKLPSSAQSWAKLDNLIAFLIVPTFYGLKFSFMSPWNFWLGDEYKL